MDLMNHQAVNHSLSSQSHTTPIYWLPQDSAHNVSSFRPNNSQWQADEKACEAYFFVTYGLLMGGLCIIGVVLNALCFAVFWRDKVNTSTTFFFKALAVVDSALLIVAFPIFPVFHGLIYLNAYTSSGYNRVFPYFMVYVWPWTLVTQTANVWLIMLIGISRYIAVCRPYNACRLCTVSQARRQLAVVLMAAVVYNLPRFFSFRISADVRLSVFINQTISNQTISTPITVIVYEAYETMLSKDYWYNVLYNNVLYFICLLFVPLVVLGALNYLLIRALAKMRKRRASMQSTAQQQDTSVTLVLVVLVVIFITCELPALFQQVLRNILPEKELACGGVLFYLRPISNVLVTLNSVVNFFVYVTFNTRFRQHFVEMMMCGRMRLGIGSERAAKYATTGTADYCRGGASYSRVHQPLSIMTANGLKPPMNANDANTLSDCDQGGGLMATTKA